MRLIDADKLVKTFCSHCVDHDECKSECMDLKIIKSMKTVDAERHGHWVKIETSKFYDCQNTVPIYKCSFCHTPFVNVDLKDRYHYCPNCGAKMDEVEKMDIKKYCIPKEEYNIPLVNDGIQEGRKLVYCKDCKYWEDGYCDDSLIEGLERKVSRFEDDFCSRGEKK